MTVTAVMIMRTMLMVAIVAMAMTVVMMHTNHSKTQNSHTIQLARQRHHQRLRRVFVGVDNKSRVHRGPISHDKLLQVRALPLQPRHLFLKDLSHQRCFHAHLEVTIVVLDVQPAVGVHPMDHPGVPVGPTREPRFNHGSHHELLFRATTLSDVRTMAMATPGCAQCWTIVMAVPCGTTRPYEGQNPGGVGETWWRPRLQLRRL